MLDFFLHFEKILLKHLKNHLIWVFFATYASIAPFCFSLQRQIAHLAD